MVALIAQWIINGFGVLAAGYFVPGVYVASLYTALITALLLGALNLLIRPILLLLMLPITLLTLGFFTLVVNAFLFWFLSTVVQGFVVHGFIPAFLGALVVSAASFIGKHILEKND